MTTQGQRPARFRLRPTADTLSAVDPRPFLTTPIQRFQPDPDASLRAFVAALTRTGGQPRRLGAAIDLWNAVAARDRLIFCSIAGAPVPMGFGPAIASLISRRAIDVLDITGAQITHDLLEVIGSLHFQGHVDADDAALASADVNRFWDTFGDEADYRRVEPMIFDFAGKLPDRPITTREYIYRMGRHFKEIGSQGGFITAAAEMATPVYCPAIGDSVLGMDLGFFRAEGHKKIVFDVVQDVLEMSAMVLLAEELGARSSTVIFGGGAPRNHIQQSQIGSYMFLAKSKGHAEAVRFSIEPAETGGLSGSTISEGISWKKFDPRVEAVEVFLDSNLSLAIAAALVDGRDASRCFQFRHEDDGTLTVLYAGAEYNLSEKYHF
jgi:deoxyhypusine synthase